jgi:enoyl-CoA hydratase/carnithine racemase
MPPTTSSDDRVVLERPDPGILVVRIAAESRANALADTMLTALAGILPGAGGDGTRCVVLTGTGERSFSAGVDLSGRAAGVEAVRAGERLLGRVVAAVRDCPCPVIAAVNGACMGGALELLVACDWRVAAEGARFGIPPARLGWVYTATGIALLRAAVGSAGARELLLAGAPVDAARAREMGLVGRVVPAAELMEAALDSARAVASCAPLAVRGMKAVLRELDRPALEHPGAARVAGEWRERVFGSRDVAEGLAAFGERRPPGFEGR